MRIGLIYRLYKEEKLNLTKEEMNALWKYYEGLGLRNYQDITIAKSYKYICGCLTGENPYDDGLTWDEAEKSRQFKVVENKLKDAAQMLLSGYNCAKLLM